MLPQAKTALCLEIKNWNPHKHTSKKKKDKTFWSRDGQGIADQPQSFSESLQSLHIDCSLFGESATTSVGCGVCLIFLSPCEQASQFHLLQCLHSKISHLYLIYIHTPSSLRVLKYGLFPRWKKKKKKKNYKSYGIQGGHLSNFSRLHNSNP